MEYSELHNTSVLHRVIGDTIPEITHSSGIYLSDSAGNLIIDASGGAAVACLGHSHPKVIAAMKAQMDEVCYVHSGSFTTPVLEELAKTLSNNSPSQINHAYFVSGGSEAIESAIKLARQYHVERGDIKRHRIIARDYSYHGNTFGALSASGHKARRKIYEPMLLSFDHVDPCFYYRHAQKGESRKAYAIRSAESLRHKIEELGPENVAAFVAETVVGATLGAATAEESYFKLIRAICDEYGVLLILDEVMSGLGRTGSMHAFEQENIVPDMVTLAKGLAGGYQPIGAVLLSDKVYGTLERGSKAFQHGLTYSGHPIAAAAALSVQKTIVEENLITNVRKQGGYLRKSLLERFGDHPNIGEIRGRGLFQGVELVTDRKNKTPFSPDQMINEKIKIEAMKLGLMIYPSPGCVDGVRGDHVLLAPPFNVTGAELDTIVDRLADAIELALKK